MMNMNENGAEGESDDETVTTTVDVSGAELQVTPLTKLPHPESITAGIISSRILTKQNRGDQESIVGMDEDMYQLLELCVEDGISRTTIESLGPYELNTIVAAVFHEEGDE